jgi:predicted DNA-binding transcriptional regulator AlpA
MQTQTELSRAAFAAVTEKRIQAAAVRELCGGVSDMWIWRRLDSDPTFPRPIYIAKRRFWRESDVIKWFNAQADRNTA